MKVKTGRARAPRRSDTAATRALLTDAARKLFADKGFTAVSTQEIVAAAGVTRGALYHQFTDKATLFAAVYEEIERDLVAEVVRRSRPSGPPTRSPR